MNGYFAARRHRRKPTARPNPSSVQVPGSGAEVSVKKADSPVAKIGSPLLHAPFSNVVVVVNCLIYQLMARKLLATEKQWYCLNNQRV